MKRRISLNQNTIEDRALLFSGIFTLITFISVIIFMNATAMHSIGIRSLGDVVAFFTAGVSILCFVIGYCDSKSNENPYNGHLSKLRRLIATFALSFSYGSICFLSIIAFSYFVSNSVPTLYLDSIMSAFTISLVVALVSYIVYLKASNMSTLKLGSLLTIFIISGTCASMITSENKYWWQNHFSALGAGSTLSSYAFNLTLIIGGILVASLADYIVSDIYRAYKDDEKYVRNKVRIVRSLFIFLGITTVLIGVFPYDRFKLIHDIFANLMAVTLVLLIIFVPILIRKFSISFSVFSYSLAAIAIGSYMLYSSKKITLLVWEIIAVMMFFAWMVIFIRQVSAMGSDKKVSSENIIEN